MNIMKRWRDAHGASPPDPIRVELFNPEEPSDGNIATVWWRTEDIASMVALVQKEMFTSPRPTIRHKLSATELGEQIITKADRLTAEVYVRAETDAKRVGILLLGGLIGRYNRHSAIAEGLPPQEVASDLMREFQRMAKGAAPSYSKRAISGIPVEQTAPDCAIDAEGLLDLLIEDTVRVLETCSIVMIRSTSEPTEKARAIMEEERLRIARQEQEAEKAREQFERMDPFAKVWMDRTAGYLLGLVWSDPVSTVAKTLGISPATLAKALKDNGIPSPGHGFWAQVKAGKRPHPEGTPDFSPNHHHEKNAPNKTRRYERIREDKRNFGRETTMNRPARRI